LKTSLTAKKDYACRSLTRFAPNPYVIIFATANVRDRAYRCNPGNGGAGVRCLRPRALRRGPKRRALGRSSVRAPPRAGRVRARQRLPVGGVGHLGSRGGDDGPRSLSSTGALTRPRHRRDRPRHGAGNLRHPRAGGRVCAGARLDSPAAIMFDELRANNSPRTSAWMETRGVDLGHSGSRQTKRRSSYGRGSPPARRPRSARRPNSWLPFKSWPTASNRNSSATTSRSSGWASTTSMVSRYTDLGSFIEGCITGTRKKMRRPPLLRRLKHFFSCEASGGMQPAIGDRFVSAIEFEELPGYARSR